jgi:hypothetical protein
MLVKNVFFLKKIKNLDDKDQNFPCNHSLAKLVTEHVRIILSDARMFLSDMPVFYVFVVRARFSRVSAVSQGTKCV